MKQSSDMLEFTTDGVMLMKEDGAVILWNKAAERLLGFFLARDVIGRPFFAGQV